MLYSGDVKGHFGKLTCSKLNSCFAEDISSCGGMQSCCAGDTPALAKAAAGWIGVSLNFWGSHLLNFNFLVSLRF
jgi:hypothetical protein